MSSSVPIGLKKMASMVILRHQDSFLLLKRNKEPNKDMYVPVGGKLDPYEGAREAAVRETKEETGLSISNPKFCGTLIESSPTKYNWQCYIYLADIDKVDPPYCNEGLLEWKTYEEIPALPTPPTDWHIYQYIMQEKAFALEAHYDANLKLLSMVEEIEGKHLI